MLIKIDFESEVPIYVQLKKQIVEGIALKRLMPGDSLPSVRQLAQDIGINLHTVNKTYNILKDEGFISMDRRKGAVISANGCSATPEYIQEFEEEIRGVIAEAYCRGMSREEFLDRCGYIYNIYEEVNDNV